ncbi:non-ribosomal peptide synthetase [Streptomyces sp. NRRL S-37]|uniref:non-ribosomal peptide synthetase n=1 Tax=Streptomyces sp. NRRL S-37 TaxID=1463903 RepID=UPI00069117FC|nr:non-ribosomal peptide synthetase [Streptomyces sp. NRRL S-37]
MEHARRDTEERDTLALLRELAEHGVLVRSRRGRLSVDAPKDAPEALLGRLTAAEGPVLEAIAAHPGLPGPRVTAPEAADGEDATTRPFPLTDLQSAYQVGESDFPRLATPAFIAHGFEVPDFDAGRWDAALRAVLTRHEMLRCAVDGDGRQRVVPLDDSWGPVRVDWRHLDAAQARAAFHRERETAARLLPALTDGPQLGCAVHSARDTTFVLLCLRLFVLDARSIGLVCRDLADAYEGRPFADPPVPSGHFARYADALDRHRDSQAYRNAVAHWRRRVPVLPGPPALPALPHPAESRFARVRHRLPAPVWQRLGERARDAGLSANTVLCAAYAEVLRRWSGQRSFSLTVLVATRGMLAVDPSGADSATGACVGNFGSTLLLECDGAGGSFAERAGALQRRLMADLPHAWLSGVGLARRVRRQRPGAEVGSPYVFASGLDDTADDALPPHLRAAGWDLVFKSMHTPQVLLDHQVSEEDGELVCTFDHVAEAFPEGLVDELAQAHADLLRRLAGEEAAWSAPHPPPLPDALTAARRSANGTARRFPGGGVLDGLREGASRTPGRVAFHGADGEVTYGEAADRVARTAGALTASGAAPGELVGVLARKSTGQYLAALSVIAAGGAYVPLGVDWPPARVDALLGRHGVGRVLADAEGARLLAALERPVTVLALDAPEPPAPTAPLPVPPADDLAYVIFTSGSTGVPKGVAIPHGGLLNTVQDMVERFGVGPEDRLLSLSELHFDLSAFDLFGGLCAGGTVVVPPSGPRPDPELWAEWVRRSGATVWNTVPALLEMLLDHLGEERAAAVLGGLRLVLLSGDWVPLDLPDRVRRAAPKAEVVALGGATEASIWSNYHVVDRIDPSWKSVPYGLPLANQRYHVLDADFADVPHWVPGELFIAGDGLATEYYGQPELTEARFPRHPRTGERLYRTGDHARYRPDGVLEFLGRVDSQVKVRGYRVDLLEVEQRLAAQAGVRAAACVVTGTGAAARLIAFLVTGPRDEGAPDDGTDLDPVALRTRLGAALPSYAVPSAFHTVPALPLTANGKRDARALLALAEEHAATERDAGRGGPSGRAPRTERETALARLWQEVCGTAVRSVDDDFFAAGGSSVSAVRLVRRIGEEFGVRLPLSSLFEASTIAGQCALLDQRVGGLLVPIRPGDGPAVVLVHPVGGHLLGYRALIDALPASYAVYGLQSPPTDELPESLEELAAEYATALAALDRPVHLVGWSMGGVLAAETARRAGLVRPLSLTLVDSFVAAPEGVGLDESAAAVGFFTDRLGQGDGGAPAGISVPAGHPDPFAHLAAAHLPDEPPETLRDLYGQYRSLYRLLLGHRPRPLPGHCPLLVVPADRERPDGFRGLTPLHRHPAGLVPSDAAVRPLPGTHYSVVRGASARLLAELIHTRISKGTA